MARGGHISTYVGNCKKKSCDSISIFVKSIIKKMNLCTVSIVVKNANNCVVKVKTTPKLIGVQTTFDLNVICICHRWNG